MIMSLQEAEELVGRWLAVDDRSAINGVAAHVPLLVPFVPVEELETALPRLEGVFSGVARQRFSFGQVGVFPQVSPTRPRRACM